MAKLLNLDDFAGEERALVLGGVEYPMVEMSVKEFVEVTSNESLMDEDMPLSEQVRLSIEMIQRRFPTCPKEKLDALNLSQLTAILDFARGEQVGEEESPKGN